MNTSYCAGIDVSKPYLDVHLLPSDRVQRFPNSAAGHRDLVGFLRKHRVGLTVLEATGGYEHAAVVALVNAGQRVHVAQPQVVRNFARVLKLRAKNDKIDASVCARYAQDYGHELRVIEKIDKTLESLQALVVRRDQLVAMHTMEQNRVQQASDKETLKSIKRSLAWMEKEITRVEKTIDAMIQADPVLRAKSEKLRATKGVGPQTTRMLVACLPELGKAGPKCLNALVGVAPYADDSGDKQGPRRIGGGRMLVRNGLYMACMTGVYTNPVLAPYYRSLIKRGLSHKTAMMACIRKLLAYLDKQISMLSPSAAA
jgi:transposase